MRFIFKFGDIPETGFDFRSRIRPILMSKYVPHPRVKLFKSDLCY